VIYEEVSRCAGGSCIAFAAHLSPKTVNVEERGDIFLLKDQTLVHIGRRNQAHFENFKMCRASALSYMLFQREGAILSIPLAS
jgi:hypothetical protein